MMFQRTARPLLAGALITIVVTLTGCSPANGARDALTLAQTITLGDVHGRIDHLAFDPTKGRLAVAELQNGSVDIVDVTGSVVLRRISGLLAPQGVAFDATGSILAVATGGDGSLHIVDAVTFDQLAAIPLGDDADDVRLDPANGHLLVGYGAGAIAVIDLASRSVVARIALPVHPEGFQIDPQRRRAFVNLPNQRTIGVIDLDRNQLIDTWRLPLLLWNYPLALDPNGDRLASVFRFPARLVLFGRTTGRALASQPTCEDADDVFFDSGRERAYIACGEGKVDAFDLSGSAPRSLGATVTRVGARTALFEPHLDRLFVAAPARNGAPAAILVLRPIP